MFRRRTQIWGRSLDRIRIAARDRARAADRDDLALARHPPARRVAAVATGVAACVAALSLAACAGHPPPPRGAAAATMVAGPLPNGPSAPDRGLPMPGLDVSWTPPMLTAGDLQALRRAVAEHRSVSLRLGDRFGGDEWSARARALVSALGPEVELVAVDDGAAEASPFGDGPLPLSRVDETDGGPDAGRPQYRWPGSWDRAALPADASAEAVLVIDDARVEPSDWGALPAHAIGSCEAPMLALATGQEQSLAELEPFLDHADGVLAQIYGPALQAAVPKLADELSPYATEREREDFDDGAAWEQYQCGRAYWDYLQAFAACGPSTPCPSAPRVFLVGGARIGSVEPSVYVPEGCAAKVGRDYVLALRSVASEAAEAATEHLAVSWVALADRLGAVTEVYEALEDVCTPRRRRFTQADLVAARQRLAAIGEALSSEAPAQPGGRWVFEDGSLHVPGTGPVQQVARYDAGPGSPSTVAIGQARALRELVLGRALCRSNRPGLPLAAALVDAQGKQVEFFGYFFEEELFCGELPPLGAEAED